MKQTMCAVEGSDALRRKFCGQRGRISCLKLRHQPVGQKTGDTMRDAKVCSFGKSRIAATGSLASASYTSGCEPTFSRNTEVLPIPCPGRVQFSTTLKVASG